VNGVLKKNPRRTGRHKNSTLNPPHLNEPASFQILTASFIVPEKPGNGGASLLGSHVFAFFKAYSVISRSACPRSRLLASFQPDASGKYDPRSSETIRRDLVPGIQGCAHALLEVPKTHAEGDAP
jgi:hypothetical protein